MSRTKLKIGQKIMPEIQLGDGGDGGTTRVFVEYQEPDTTVITAEFELPHLGDGIYREDTTAMPDEDILVVQYYIRLADGTSPSNTYDPNYLTEVFLRDVTGQIVDDNLDKKISSVSCPSDLQISLIDDKLTAQVEEFALTAVLNDNEVLIGVVNEC